MRVLVTGAAGFIGSTTAELLVSLGHDVVAVDDLSVGLLANVPAGATFVQGSIGDRDLIQSIGSLDACVHFAGLIAPGDSMKVPETFFTNNVSQTLELLHALIDMKVKKFVFSSSCAVYGDKVTIPIDESHPLNPHSPYGQSKLMVEQALRWLNDLGKIKSASLRYFNAAGATMFHPENHVPEFHLIPMALAAARGTRERLDLYGDDYETPDGTCIRDYVHVSDLASAHVLAIGALDRQDQLVLNLGSGTGYSNRAIIEAVKEVTGVDFEVRVTARRPGDPAAAVASNEAARRLLGWELHHSSLAEIVTDAWSAFQTL